MNTKSPAVLTTPWKKAIFNQSEFYDAWEKSDRFFYAHLVNQTLRGVYSYLLNPDQVFYVGPHPTAYILTVDGTPAPEDEVRWRKFLWNQSVVPILIVNAKQEIRIYTAHEYKQDLAKTLKFAADALDLLETKIESGAFFKENSDHFNRKQAVDQYLLNNLNDAVDVLCRSSLSEENRRFVARIEAQGKNAKSSDREKVDHLIFEQQEFVQLYLTRILFICYLIDRGMLKGEYFASHGRLNKIAPADSSSPYRLANILKECTTSNEKRDVIRRVFAETKKRFNGSLFEYGKGSKQSDAPEVSDKFLSDLTAFLNGDEIKKGQKVFDFRAYDFNIIPIETISSIYESFLNAQGIQRTSGAYYTPSHLAELVVDIALENIKNEKIYEKKVLDPSCGSGVFLVSLFCRMADQLRRHLKYKSVTPCSNWGREVLNLLTRIYGIDCNSTACHIACFSLYLAALEQLKPTDLEYLEDGILPPLLSDPEKGHERGKNIFKANFFDPGLPVEGEKFDLIVGNPPWVSRQNQVDEVFSAWEKENSKSRPTPKHQIAYGFLWKTKQFIDANGTVCLLVPSSVLWSTQTNVFLNTWLRQTTVERVVNFSDLSFLLFADADHPCIAIRYKRDYSETNGGFITFESPKVDVRSRIGGPLLIREEDRTHIFQENAIASAAAGNSTMTWKVPFWGKGRDQQLIERLSVLPKLGELFPPIPRKTPQKEVPPLKWCSGDGIKGMECDNPKKGSWSHTTLFLDPSDFDRQGLIVDPSILKTTEEWEIPSEVERPRVPQLFSGPRVLVSQGTRINVAYCDFDLVFKDSIAAFCGPSDCVDLLRFLSVVIKSDLMRYYLFHSSSCWGSERDRVMLFEYRSIPFFPPEKAPNPLDAQKCMDRVLTVFAEYEQKAKAAYRSLRDEVFHVFDFVFESKKVRDECEPHIRKYYGINRFEGHLIDDTHEYIIDSTTPSSPSTNMPTLKQVDEGQCRRYANELVDMLKAFSWKEKGYPYSAHVFRPGPNDQYGVVQVDRSQEKDKHVTISEEPKKLQDAIQRISKHLNQFESERIIQCVNLKVYDGDSLFILKPAQLRFWTRIAAQNDADEIGGSLAQRHGRAK